MRRIVAIGLAVAIAVLLTPAAAFAEAVVIEAQAGLKTCDHVHAVDGESKCTRYHVTIKADDPAPVEPGATLQLNGEPYVIQWIGDGYYTASGKVLHLKGSSGASSLELIELRLGTDAQHQAGWQDVNGDGELSVSDTVSINGISEIIVDKRLNLRIVPAH